MNIDTAGVSGKDNSDLNQGKGISADPSNYITINIKEKLHYANVIMRLGPLLVAEKDNLTMNKEDEMSIEPTKFVPSKHWGKTTMWRSDYETTSKSYFITC